MPPKPAAFASKKGKAVTARLIVRRPAGHPTILGTEPGQAAESERQVRHARRYPQDQPAATAAAETIT